MSFLEPPYSTDAHGHTKLDVRNPAHFDHQGAQVWRVEWNSTGTLLASSGDDGCVKLWKGTGPFSSGPWGSKVSTNWICMETCMLLCFHVHIYRKTYMFTCNVHMKAQKHACFHVLLQLVLTFDPHWKRVHSLCSLSFYSASMDHCITVVV